jgi:hypothetical protein
MIKDVSFRIGSGELRGSRRSREGKPGDLYHAETVGILAAQQNDLPSVMRHYVPGLSLLMRKGAINAGLAETPLRGLRRLFFVDVNDCGFVVYQMVQLRRRAVREITTRFKRRGKFVAGESSVVISLGLERVRRAEGIALRITSCMIRRTKLRSESDLGNPCSRRSSTASCN